MAVDETELLRLTGDAFQRVLERHPVVRAKLLELHRLRSGGAAAAGP